jgi:hypothetical protein
MVSLDAQTTRRRPSSRAAWKMLYVLRVYAKWRKTYSEWAGALSGFLPQISGFEAEDSDHRRRGAPEPSSAPRRPSMRGAT